MKLKRSSSSSSPSSPSSPSSSSSSSIASSSLVVTFLYLYLYLYTILISTSCTKAQESASIINNNNNNNNNNINNNINIIRSKMTAVTTPPEDGATTTTTTTSTSTSSSKQKKTIYLIRHAESEENRRLGSLKSSFKGLCRLKIPKKADVVASMELLNVSANIDSDVSPKGQQQIDQLGKRLAKDDFVRKMGIELVAHSPLKRARQTSFGMLQCSTPIDTVDNDIGNDNNNDNDNDNDGTVGDNNITDNTKSNDHGNDPSAKGSKHPSVKRVIELELLEERTPKEWLPTNFSSYSKRIQEFEQWLAEQPEGVVAIVGHSQYFRSMLGLKSLFHNVDVWSLEFDPEVIRRRNDANTINDNDTGEGVKEETDGRIINNEGDEANEDEATAGGAGIVTELDGKPLGEIHLPPGWNQLKHHYRYDSKYTE